MKARGRGLESDLEAQHHRYAELGLRIERLQPPSIAGAGGRLRATDDGPADFAGEGHVLEAKESSQLDWDSSLLRRHQRAYLERAFFEGLQPWVYLRLTSPTLRTEARDAVLTPKGRVKRKAIPAQRHQHDWLIPWPALRARYATEKPGHITPGWLMSNAVAVADCDWLAAASTF